ncbi:type VII secretion protein EccB [Streptomyces sp. SID8379]|uniref:type VII secretion protein EccB n=1 Tax=unclassified Streptomyces TaxID=2593676 RepID=UPI00039A9002|nr:MULTISPECIES: type VII secretion protein EccB [unclassified Streptomyces]MYW69557.1 type VII secretion protein EccB [Streptomyces sp. SID8379]
MASRRDELNAYNFSRKRTVAAFLKPLPNGSVESAPRPLKHAISGIVMSVVILAGFGACGLMSPVAPEGWDTPEAGIIVTDPSATRYIVLPSAKKRKDGKDIPVLHPVLNLASAKLLLDPKKSNEGSVKTVKEKFLDESDIAQGSMVGIPYAPDRLPSVEDAGTSKVWALCQQTSASSDEKSVQQTVFVLDDKDAKTVTEKGSGKLASSQALYVQDKRGKQYLVSSSGVAYELTGDTPEEVEALVRTLFGNAAEPRTVTDAWLSTLGTAQEPISMPSVQGDGGPSNAGVPSKFRTTGTLLQTRNGQHYLVEKDRVIAVSDFQTTLLKETLADPRTQTIQQNSFTPDPGTLTGGAKWPTRAISWANSGPNDTSCSVFHGDKSSGLTTWTGSSLPISSVAASASSYVSPGSGLLYQEAEGNSSTGYNYLVTDTGLRYFLPVGNDSDDKSGNEKQDVNQAKIRLGYENARKVSVPAQWSKLLPSGPNLTTEAAKQTQNS